MTSKTLIERGTGRTARLAVQCAMDALKNPGQSIAIFDHDNRINQHLVFKVKEILNVIHVPFQVSGPNLLTVMPIGSKP